MSAYEIGHLAFMRGFQILGALLGLAGLGMALVLLWRAARSATDGHQDGEGYHRDRAAPREHPHFTRHAVNSRSEIFGHVPAPQKRRTR